MAKKAPKYQATLREMLALETPNDIRISPDGMRVAYTVKTANWKDNRYEHDCFIYDEATGKTNQLTRTGNVNQMEWVDDETLGLLRENGGKVQVFLFEGGTGEGWQLTDHKTGVEWFHPFAGGIVFLARQPDKDEKKERTGQYGTYTHFEQEESASAVYYTGIHEMREYKKQWRALTEEDGNKLVLPVIELSKLFNDPIAIKEILTSPVGDALYLNCWRRDDMVYARETRVFQINMNASSALAKHIELEKAKQAEKKESPPEIKKKEDISYLGQAVEL